MGEFADKVVVVTGGSSGIGKATAEKFARDGAHVIITGRDKKRLESTSSEIGAKGIVYDVGGLASLNKLFEQFDRIDVLIVNAGISEFKPMVEVTEESYNAIMNTNVKGAFFTV